MWISSFCRRLRFSSCPAASICGLVRKDWFQTLPDFNAYVVRKGQALSDYACDPLGWRKKCVINIAKAGLFSSDRTIAEYNKDIWHLGE